MTHPTDALRLVPSRDDGLTVGCAILEAHSQWEKEHGVTGSQNPWQEPHLILLGQAAILAAPASPLPEGGGWQDLIGAPRDGSEFQAWWKGTWQPRARFDPEYGSFQLWGRTDFDTEGWEVFEIDGFWQTQPAAPTGAK